MEFKQVIFSYGFFVGGGGGYLLPVSGIGELFK